MGDLLYNGIKSAFEFFLSTDMLLEPIWVFLVEVVAFSLGLLFVVTTFFLPMILLYKAIKNRGHR
jgi:hypothetical protein